MTIHRFTHVHASGRFDVPLADVRTDWDNFRTNPDVALITGTEHGSGDHDPAFAAPGWDGKRAGECVAMWREGVFELAWEPSVRPVARKFTFRRGSNKDATTNLASFPLRHLAANRIVMVRICHTPSKVQQGESFRHSEKRNVTAWSRALARWGWIARRFKRDHYLAAQINVADWNVNLRLRRWRVLIGTTLGQRCAWSKHMPKEGTHGPRLIDGVFYRLLKVAAAEVLPKGKSSDHRPITTTFVVTSKGA